MQPTEISTPPPSWYAIVIGTDAYPGLQGGQLKGCVNDAVSMKDFLLDKVGVPAANLELLTSPELPGGKLSTAANIRAALATLSSRSSLRAGDQVVLYYACHGLRLEPSDSVSARPIYYGLASADLSQGAGDSWSNLIIDREINRFLRALARRQVSVTVIADTCHSGASTRDLAGKGRARTLPPVELRDDAERTKFLATHPAFAESADAGNESHAGEQSQERIGRGLSAQADFVVLAACQDGETAKEAYEDVLNADGTLVRVDHGMLTLSLLEVLRKIPAAQIRSLRWLDFFDDLQKTVARRAAQQPLGPQRPALEGRPERTVFGGAWTPFAPGYTARRAEGVYRIDGGILHGIDQGAELELYPADTADFEAAADRAVRATVISATLSTSEAALIDESAMPSMEDKARARLVKPSPSQRPLLVRLRDLPTSIASAASLDDARTADFVRVAGENAPAHVEVRPFLGVLPNTLFPADSAPQQAFFGARDGFVVVRSDVAGAPAQLPADFKPAPEDIIAYLPGAGPLVERLEERELLLGQALRDGLVYYARYLHTRDRSSPDDRLRPMLSVKLRIGTGEVPDELDSERQAQELIEQTTYCSPEAGVHRMRDSDWLFLEVRVLRRTTLRLFAGFIVCSDDGNVVAMWPPSGENYTFSPGQVTYIGQDRFNPLFLPCRPDLKFSLWTLKLIAYTANQDSEPINLHGLSQMKSVQDIFAAVLQYGRALPEKPRKQPELPAWYTWDFRVACERS